MGVVSSQTHVSTLYCLSLFYTAQARFCHAVATTLPHNTVPILKKIWQLALENINTIARKSLKWPT